MRYILSMLILLISLSFFTVACGGGDDTTGSSSDACSATNVNGTCESGKHCDNGVCVPDSCTPQCAGKTCGDDGCGGTCGTCNAGETCNANGICETGNNGEACSPSNPNGTCEAGKHCDNGTCVADSCTPNCAGKTCGDDGCGGTCGTCNAGETCNANGTCEAAAGAGELGGSCDQQTPCNDSTNLCLSSQDGQSRCYQACNGANDNSCTQNGYICQDTGNADIGWICLPNPTGNTPIGGDCSNEACVAEAICLNPDAPTCYEKCSAATDTCQTEGYKCQDTGNAEIGWVCAPSSEPGNAQPGEECSAENNCVETAMCLTKQGETVSHCYEKCTGTGDTCSQGSNYECVDTGNANIGWICMEKAQPGNAQPGESCSAENNCVETAMCLTTDNVNFTCYEKCTGADDTCSQTNYTCQDTQNAQIGWICMTNPVGNTPIGGDCSNEACVEEASCLTDGTNSLCYEKCDPNTGGACSQSGYTCEAVAGGNYCMPPQGN